MRFWLRSLVYQLGMRKMRLEYSTLALDRQDVSQHRESMSSPAADCDAIESNAEVMTQDRKFFTWRKCSTCRDAKKALDGLGVEVDERDFFENAMSREELGGLVDAIGIDSLFSWRSPSSKPFRDRRDTISRDELIDAMLDEPRLIRRPIVISPNVVPIVGFDKSAYAKLAQ